jgi:hypothetical protein
MIDLKSAAQPGLSQGSKSATSHQAALWQHPYVDVFKHFKVMPQGDWRQNKKQGDVDEIFVRPSFFKSY